MLLQLQLPLPRLLPWLLLWLWWWLSLLAVLVLVVEGGALDKSGGRRGSGARRRAPSGTRRAGGALGSRALGSPRFQRPGYEGEGLAVGPWVERRGVRRAPAWERPGLRFLRRVKLAEVFCQGLQHECSAMM